MKSFRIHLVLMLCASFFASNLQAAITVFDLFQEDYIITAKSTPGSSVMVFNSYDTRFELFSDNKEYRVAYEYVSGVPLTDLDLFYRSPSSSSFYYVGNHLDDPDVNNSSYEIQLKDRGKLDFRGKTNKSYIDPKWCGQTKIKVTFYKVQLVPKTVLYVSHTAYITIIWDDHCGWSDEGTFGGMTDDDHPLTSTSGGNATYGILGSQAHSWQVFYAANDAGTSDRRMYNVYGSWINEYSFCRNTGNPGSETPVSNYGTNFVEADGGIYFVNNQQKITKATWNATNGWTYSAVNNNAHPVMHNTHIAVDGTGKVFYVGSDGIIRNIYGPTWQHGPLDIQAPTARSNSDLLLADNGRVYYTGSDDKVHYFEWNGQWNSYVANNFAPLVKDNSEIAQGDGHLFYVDQNNKVRSIDGPLSYQQYVVNASAPNAYGSDRMGLEYTIGKVLYFDINRDMHNLYWDGSVWKSAPITGCGVRGKIGSPISVNGNGEIWYVNEFTNQPHKQVYTYCEESGKVGSSDPVALQTENTNPSSLDQNQLSIYPNPSSGRFTLSNLQKEEIKYEILNSTGTLIMDGKVQSDSKTEINLGEYLPRGLYLIRWQSSYSDDINTERIILQ
ncbi:T9SS type A sorting domain-containing protein [bacterium SCSIO 12741]|nr:T9SS type A sorting domain-containing protein [bacterium SCSIO 12741]